MRNNDFMNNIEDLEHEYCPRCQADLTLQKGYSNELPYWICNGCGEMLINPNVESDSNIAWICDGCGAMLNIQPGFSEDCGKWTCTECGYENKIDLSELYLSEDEYQAEKMNPYKGLTDDEVLMLSMYSEEGCIDGRGDVLLIKNEENGKLYVKKYLTTYNRSIYDYLKEHPINHMPRIYEVCESDNCLIVIEEYIEGRTLDEILDNGPVPKEEALSIIKNLCTIVNTLHTLQNPIIHRDIKPTNVIITDSKDVYLLDMNVAKWYDPEESDDTRYLGTQNFAAPEQVGYGLSASSTKSDIYAIGILLNVMLTGKFPKEARPEGELWNLIEGCISLDAKDRYDADELIIELDKHIRNI